MIEVKLPAMESWLRKLYDLYDESPNGKIFVTKAVRQVGKSICLEILLIAASLRLEYSKSKVVSPVFSQATKLFDDITRIGEGIIKKTNAATRTITFINDSMIEFSSAELGDNLRGFTVKGSGILAVDEAAYIDDNLFYSVLLPMTNVYNSDIFIFSTPESKLGFFYDLFMQGIDPNDPKVVSLDWTTYDTSKFLSPEQLEIYRKKLPAATFKSLYLGLWIENQCSVFGDFLSILKKAPATNGPYFIGIDWASGTGGDYTSISVFDIDRRMVDLIYFNDKDETETIGIIVNIVSKYRPRKVSVELNSIGRVFYGLLEKAIKNNKLTKHTSVVGFNTTNESKDKIISNLQVHILNGTVSLLPDAELIKQFNNYEMKFSGTGKRIYANKAGTGNHDDIVMSTAIALDSISTGQYTISIV